MSDPAPRIDLAAVTDAYGAWAHAYIELFGSADLADAEDRDLIAGWARSVTGPVLDAGCGPGHWSAFLAAQGLEVEGVDATPAFVAHASRSFPPIPFRVADLREIDLARGSLGGVLAWYSVIHAPPDEAVGVLRRLARALRPGGGLLIGFFAGDRLERFDHRVVTGWTWPVAELAAALESVGLEVADRNERAASNGRRNAWIIARRRPPSGQEQPLRGA